MPDQPRFAAEIQGHSQGHLPSIQESQRLSGASACRAQIAHEIRRVPEAS